MELQQLYVEAAMRARDGRASTSSTSTSPTAYLPLQFLSPFYNKRTDEYGGSVREPRPLLDARCSSRCARPSATTARSRSASRSTRCRRRSGSVEDGRRTAALHRVHGRPRGLLGPRRRRHRRVGRERRPVAHSSRRTTRAVHGRRQGGPHRQAGHQRRPLHQPRHDGRGHQRAASSTSSARRRPSISDPFLPEEDRGGPARRHPRVHRLQHVRLALGDRRPADRLHAERDRRRGVPARLAPGELLQGAEPRQDVLVVGAGPAGMECAMVLGKRGMRRVHLVDAEAEMGGCAGSPSSGTPTARRTWPAAPPAASASGRGSSTTARSSSTSCRTSRCTSTRA